MSLFDEMKRYVRFGPDDEAALRALHPHARGRFRAITEEFYDRLSEHEEAAAVFSGPEQVERLKRTLVVWMDGLFLGPWDEAYHERRARIGRVHVRIALPQRYMFGAMDLMRVAFQRLGHEAFAGDPAAQIAVVTAIAKIVDLELAIMLETYREANLAKVQEVERLEKQLLTDRLELSEARYAEIVEAGEALIATIDADGRLLFVNRRGEAMLGQDRTEVAGQGFVATFVREADRLEVEGCLAAVRRGGRCPPFAGPVPRPDGRRIRWHFTRLPGDAPPLVCAIGLDVTEEHELSRRTQRAERLAALGTMASALAHEVRNPLNAASLQLALATRRLHRLPEGPDAAQALTAAGLARGEMKRLAFLVEEFLLFARPQPIRRVDGELRETAAAVVALLEPQADEAGVSLLTPGPEVRAAFDDERMKQVVHNLVRNAIEAAAATGGRVAVRVARAADRAVLEVQDDGAGLALPDAPIFEPFYTTKPTGTGLGLSIVHRIVSDHGGQVGVDSAPGRTVFTVTLFDSPA